MAFGGGRRVEGDDEVRGMDRGSGGRRVVVGKTVCRTDTESAKHVGSSDPCHEIESVSLKLRDVEGEIEGAKCSFPYPTTLPFI
jgi:hypothetical protein